MKTLLNTTFAVILLASFAHGQDYNRRRIYPPSYTGQTIRPGLSVYPRSGYYSRDYPASRSWYHYGYTPPRTNYPLRYNNSIIYGPVYPPVYYGGRR